MDLKPVPQLHITITANPEKGAQALPKFLHVGQIVSATVIAPTTSQGQSVLNINGELISATADKLLAAGDSLNLKVAQLPTLPFAKALNVPIQQVSQAQVTLLLTAPEPLLKSWQAGSVLQAMILDQKPSGQTLLDIGGSLLQADAAQVLRRGQPIAIQISNLANPILARIVAESIQGLAQAGDKQALNTPHSAIPVDAAATRVGFNLAIAPGLRLQLPALLMNQVQAGQQLDSTVTSAMVNGRAMLNINGSSVNVQTSLPLTQGQQLSLQLIDLGKPAILIPVDSTNTENRTLHTTQNAIQNTIQNALRQLLPQQSGLPELINTLTALSQPTTQTTAVMNSISPTVGEQLRFLAQQILQQLPRSTDAGTAAGFKAALKQSGVFLENQLAAAINQQQSIPNNDLKANLLRLLALLQRHPPGVSNQPTTGKTPNPNSNPVNTDRTPLPPLRYSQLQAQARIATNIMQQLNSQTLFNELLRQLTGALARIQLQQLASLGNEDETTRVQLTEVPIRHDHGTDVFHIRIEEDRHQKQMAKREKTWSVTLAFDIGKFGPLHVKLSLIKDVINTTFWAEQEDTKQLIDSQLAILHQNFVKAGLGIGHMICHLGLPPQPIPPKTQARFIVDTQA